MNFSGTGKAMWAIHVALAVVENILAYSSLSRLVCFLP